MRNIDVMRILLPPDDNSSDLRLGYLLSSAENMLLDYIGRDTLPPRLSDAVVQTALALYNRLGNEGEDKRTENDISVSFSDIINDDIRQRLKNYPRKVGTVNAAHTEKT